MEKVDFCKSGQKIDGTLPGEPAWVQHASLIFLASDGSVMSFSMLHICLCVWHEELDYYRHGGMWASKLKIMHLDYDIVVSLEVKVTVFWLW